jgi:hypothetical protein
MDGFGWFGAERVTELCTPRMAAVLTQALDGGRVFEMLRAPSRRPASPPEAPSCVRA